MANITRIKASSSSEKQDNDAEEITRKVRVKAKNSDNKKAAEATKAKLKKIEAKEKAAEKKAKKAGKKTRKSDDEVGYFRGAVREMRQVRWPDRKTSWKLTFTVIGYVVLISVLIMLLDALFTFIFNKLLGGN